MDLIKKIWPTPFKVKKGDVVSLVIQLVILLLICVVGGFVIGLLSGLPLIGWLFSLIGGLIDLYGLIGIILSILKFIDKV